MRATVFRTTKAAKHSQDSKRELVIGNQNIKKLYSVCTALIVTSAKVVIFPAWPARLSLH